MKTRSVENQEWWAGTAGEKWAFFRDVMRLAVNVEDGQLLRLEFNGHNFTPTLMGQSNRPAGGGAKAMAGDGPSAEPWWAVVPDGERILIHPIARMLRSAKRNQLQEVARASASARWSSRPRPTTQPRDGHLMTIEGLLVDLSIERRTLHLMDEGEYFCLFPNLAGHSRVSLAVVLDYARERRPARLRLIQHIKAEFLENSALVS
jgi:hypothetical protein